MATPIPPDIMRSGRSIPTQRNENVREQVHFPVDLKKKRALEFLAERKGMPLNRYLLAELDAILMREGFDPDSLPDPSPSTKG